MMAKPLDPVGRPAPVGCRAIPRGIKKAVEHMRASPDPKMTIGELVQVCGVPERTLYRLFRAFIGLSPLAYWRQLRLSAARQCLLSGGGESVSEVAIRHGFEHFGRFSTQYRRSFGEPPSATLSRVRTAALCAGRERDSATQSGEAHFHVRLARGKPSVAILPCQVSAAKQEHRFFAECVAEGIGAALSRVRFISVVTPRSSQCNALFDRQRLARLAREVDARYLLAGRIAQSGERVRVLIRLLEATTGRHLWGDSFDGEIDDLFGLQDRVTEGVIKAILPNVRGAEIERARRTPPQDMDAYLLTMQAFPFVFAANPDATRRALELLQRAMEIDPDYALATALAAWCHAQLVMHNGTRALAQEKAWALRLALRAAMLDSDDPLVLTARCAVHTMAREFAAAGALLARALALDPISGWAWERSGWLNTYVGKPEAAIEHFGRAIQRDPSSASNANRFIGIGSAHFEAGHYDLAAFWMRKALLEQPGTGWVNRTLAVSYSRLGERWSALDSLEAFRRYCPDVTVGQVAQALPFTRDFLDRVGDGLSELGLPR
jgi:TolB-like protein